MAAAAARAWRAAIRALWRRGVTGSCSVDAIGFGFALESALRRVAVRCGVARSRNVSGERTSPSPGAEFVNTGEVLRADWLRLLRSRFAGGTSSKSLIEPRVGSFRTDVDDVAGVVGSRRDSLFRFGERLPSMTCVSCCNCDLLALLVGRGCELSSFAWSWRCPNAATSASTSGI